MKITKRLKPLHRWTNLPGPPLHGMSSVWENQQGDRVHGLGLLKTKDSKSYFATDNEQIEKYHLARRMQPGRRIRALLVWAELILSES